MRLICVFWQVFGNLRQKIAKPTNRAGSSSVLVVAHATSASLTLERFGAKRFRCQSTGSLFALAFQSIFYVKIEKTQPWLGSGFDGFCVGHLHPCAKSR